MKVFTDSVTSVGGRIRNEDCCLIDAGESLYLIADGMGGHEAGDVASRMAVDEILNYVKAHKDEADTDPAAALKNAIFAAHSEIMKLEFDRKRPGTTVVAMIIRDGTAYICHVGDSRAYIYSNDSLTQLTTDHSCGRYTLLQCLGQCNDDLQPGMVILELEKMRGTKTVLLCTDGVHSVLDRDTINAFLKTGTRSRLQHATVSRLASQIVQSAIDEGTSDNATAVVIRITE